MLSESTPHMVWQRHRRGRAVAPWLGNLGGAADHLVAHQLEQGNGLRPNPLDHGPRDVGHHVRRRYDRIILGGGGLIGRCLRRHGRGRRETRHDGTALGTSWSCRFRRQGWTNDLARRDDRRRLPRCG